MDVVKEMGLTPQDFLRSLEIGLGDSFRVDGQLVELGTPEDGVTIRFEPLEPRRLSGLIALPRARVTLSFRGYDEARQCAFLERFDRAFQRGGG
jgi:hypothetical protein